LVDVTDYPEVNDLILASDAAVLDYSSLRFDFALTRKPMVFLVPDLEVYSGPVRGFLYDFRSTAPGPLLDDADDVVEALRDLNGLAAAHRDEVEKFLDTYQRWQDGHATERVVEAFFGDPLGSV
jgi:CDP-glycerol glycerophosphotransferase